MNEESMNNLVESMYSKIMERPNIILGIFNDFFKEENVDMQGIMSLQRFKSWIDCTPVIDYTSPLWDNAEKYSLEDKTLFDLSPEQQEKVSTGVEDNLIIPLIISKKFRDINIIVHFPHVRVTNEHDRYTDINHLYAKVTIRANGTMNGKFSLNRSEYTLLHLNSGYMHSHVYSIPTSNFTAFQVPCLGSGPITETINNLNYNFDEGFWNMFCLELSKYVTVESLSGVPYHKLESLGSENMELGDGVFVVYKSCPYFGTDLSKDKLREFIRYFINTKKLKFNFVNDSYSIGMSFIEYMVLISNEFISWYNDQFNKSLVTVSFDRLKAISLIKGGIIDNGKLYFDKGIRNNNRYTDYIGKRVCTFKGREITISITDIAEVTNENKNVFLNTQFSLYVLNIILKVLNYRYGKDKEVTQDGQLSTEVRYL